MILLSATIWTLAVCLIFHCGWMNWRHTTTSLPQKDVEKVPLKMVIFHSYVTLPEGIYIVNLRITTGFVEQVEHLKILKSPP